MTSLNQAHHLGQSRTYKEEEECNAWGSPQDRGEHSIYFYPNFPKITVKLCER